MPRIRSLKPEHKQHRKIGPLNDRHYRLWVGLITEADDEGRLVADPDQLRTLIFGYHPRVHARDVQVGLEHLAALGLIHIYLVKDTQYAFLPSWQDHQRVNRPSPSKLPAWEASLNVREPSLKTHAGSDQGSEGIKDQGGEASKDRPHEAAASPPQRVQFQVPVSVVSALDRAPTLGAIPRLRDPAYWQAEVRANPGVSYGDEVLKAEAWLRANPARAPHKDFPRFLHTWLGRADRNGAAHA